MRVFLMCALLAAPLCALDVDALYDKWSERERTHLLGRDVQDDETLIEHLAHRACGPNDERAPWSSTPNACATELA